ncbi:MAG TPA: hypothetical protein DF712_14970, partial [Balneola sp.]|nr:hypothetical protein [Balneola sp.]
MKKPENKKVIDTTTKKTQEEKEESKKEKEQREKEEKTSLIKNIRGFEIDANQVLKTQSDKSIKERMRDNIESLKALIQTSSLDALSNSELKTLQSSIQSINNGTFNHAAYEILNILRTDLKGKLIKDLAVEGIKYKSKGGKLDKLSDISFEIDSMVNKLFVDSALRKEMQNNPLGMLELMLGLKVGKGLNEVLLEDAASEQQQLTLETRKIQESLSKLQVKLQEDTGTNNKFLEASYEVMAYLINQEVVTNEGNTQMVKDGATAFLDETIKFTRTNKNLNKRTKDVTISILNNVKNKQPKTLTEESVREQREKLTPLQRRIVQEVQKINQDLAPKAAYTAAVIRGKNFSSRPDYVHLHVRKQPDSEMEDLENRRKQFSKKPSTKSVTLEDRTGSANPLNFDVFTSVFRGATQTLE